MPADLSGQVPLPYDVNADLLPVHDVKGVPNLTTRLASSSCLCGDVDQLTWTGRSRPGRLRTVMVVVSTRSGRGLVWTPCGCATEYGSGCDDAEFVAFGVL